MPASVQLNIPKPCQEDWQQMTPGDQGRHCKACRKTVVDFSAMTDREILNHFKKATGEVCGRFTTDQLNKNLPLPEQKRTPFWIYTWNLVVAVSLFAINGRGQAKSTNTSHGKTRPVASRPMVLGFAIQEPVLAPPREVISCFILDKETKKPVPYASVSVNEKSFAAAADSAGRFKMDKTGTGDPKTLEISAIGYKTIKVALAGNSTGREICLEPEADLMDGVTVISYPTITCGGLTGMVSYTRKDTLLTKAVREATNLFPVLKTDIKIYPNPAMRESTINIKLALKETGKYSLEVFSADGKLVHLQPLEMSIKERVISMPVGPSWGNGSYWIRISGGYTNKVYQAKLLVQ